MRRVASVCVVAVVVFIVLLLDPFPGDGCNGGCYSTPIVGEGPCFLGEDSPELVTLLGTAVLDPAQNRPLCLIDIVLPAERSSNSYLRQGETDTFYVREGMITFGLNDVPDWDLDVGFVRVVPATAEDEENLAGAGLEEQPDGSYLAETGDGPFTISAGSSIYVDNQQGDVGLSYLNETGEQASLLISSAPPVGGGEGTPEASPQP